MSASHRTLPNGIEIIIKREYTLQESSGIIVLVVTSFISLSAVILLLCAITVSVFKSKGTFDKHIFLRTHVAGYFFSLMVCFILQEIASIMNARWIHRGGLEAGRFCTSQGALKHFADVGMALWTLVIAVHSFCLLFWEMEGLSIFNLWATLIGGWFAIGAIVISGPALLDLGKMGPYYSISGYWCWISPQYKTQQIVLGWLMLLFAAVFSLILYPLIFLRLRGNIIKNGWRIKLTRTAEENIKKWHGLTTDHSIRVAKQMLLYPVTYTLLILPIVISRLIECSDKEVTLGGMIFSDTVYQLSGLVNVVLLIVTRPVLASESLLFKGWNISWPFERGESGSEGSSTNSDSDSRHPTNTDTSVDAKITSTSSLPQYPTFNINKSLSVKSGPSWTQREIKQPPQITIRDSIGSIYSIYDDHPNFESEPPQPLSSQWSPDTPPKSGKR